MIKIKDYIFNENKIVQININERNNLEIDVDNGFPRVIKDANFSDIEWNYGVTQDKIKELEEENNKLKAEVDLLNNNKHYLNNKIGKAIEYIENDTFKCKNQYQQELYDYNLFKILKGE